MSFIAPSNQEEGDKACYYIVTCKGHQPIRHDKKMPIHTFDAELVSMSIGVLEQLALLEI